MPTTALIAALVIVLLPVPVQATPIGDQLNTAGEHLEKVIEDYNEVRDNLRTTRRQIADLNEEIRPLERQLAARQARVGVIAATAYRSSGVSTALAVISAESASDFADRLLVLERLAGEQSQEIDKLNAARERVEAARHTLDSAASQQAAQELTLATKRQEIEQDIARLEQLREQTGFKPRPTLKGFKPTFSAGKAGAAVRFAYAQLGKEYRFGSGGPNSYDCSGLTSAAWAKAGVPLPHNARRQWRAVKRVSRDELKPGDLIFYYRSIHHVAMYVGGGKMIHAPQHGEPVRVDDVDYQPIHGYGRPS
ncbi:C40 family peptidase [Micromonospora sp. CPCC 206061]|uniref:C40 family peptidase n=1 Tax=Micromonospora sp. CPCC 206061 TaxID=3122410 RepID=UPI002FF32F7F